MARVRKNGDEGLRELYRQAEHDVFAAKRYVRALERAGKGEKVLDRPLTAREIKALDPGDGTVTGLVRVSLASIFGDGDGGFEHFLDVLDGEGLIFRVTGSTDVLDLEDDDQGYCARCDAPVFPPETFLNEEGVCNLCAPGETDEDES